MKTLITVAAIGACLAATSAHAQTSGHVDWQSWSFDYNVSGNYDGVSLTNVSFNGLELIGKASLPVMRVYYQDDVCGPYADRLGGTLQPTEWAGNATVVSREFTMEGEQWYEIGIQDKIGNYYIYQSWYLSASGVLDAHIFSKGLQCNTFHEHLPYWRFDFDIAGSGSDRIDKLTASGWETLSSEFDAPATDAVSHSWRVSDVATGDEVMIMFDNGQGNVPGDIVPEEDYVNSAVFGRRYRASEDEGWPYGAQAEVPFNNGEAIDGEDLVLWYKAYMPHTAEEGPDLWHSTGIRLFLNTQSLVFNPGDQLSALGEQVNLQIGHSPVEPLTFSASGLPPGLALDSNSGVISGLPSVAGAFSVSITATPTNGGNPESVSFNWEITPQQSCQVFASTDVPLAITSSGTPTILSEVTVAGMGEIADVDILNLRGEHTYMGDLEFILSSPAGTDITVMARSCGSQDDFDINFDDDAGAYHPCPPTGGGTWRPDNPLTPLLGEAANGTWQLTVNDLADRDGGALEGWGLRICELVAPPTNSPPSLATIPNQTGVVGTAATLSAAATDPDGDPLTYTASRLPDGLGISDSLGEITGTLQSAGVYDVVVRVSDGQLADSTVFSWAVTEPAGLSNVALMATVEQSSTAYGGDAERANDGNVDGLFNRSNSVTHTNHDQNAWWEADLGGLYDIDVINVYNRTDCCGSRLSNFHVLVSSLPFESRELNQAQNQLGVSDYHLPGDASESNVVPVGRLGRYVRVQLAGKNFLNLAEVEIMATPFAGGNQPPLIATVDDQTSFQRSSVSLQLEATDPDGDNILWDAQNLPTGLGIDEATGLISGTVDAIAQGNYTVEVAAQDGVDTTNASFTWTIIDGSSVATNVAPLGAASQSSTAYGGVAARANDGETNGRFGNNSVTHTNHDRNAWWQLDLGELYDIQDIVVYNRSDCCTTRLDNFHVFVTSLPFDDAGLSATQNQPGVNDYPVTAAQSENVVDVDRLGRYVRIQLAGKNFLNLAEVAVIATTFDGGNQAPLLAGIADRDDFEFEAISFSVDAIDPDDASGAGLTFTADGLPPGVDITPSGPNAGLVSGAIDGGSAGLYASTITVSDGTASASQSFEWTVIDGSVVATNVALGASATQSSTAYDGVAGRAVDGSTNGFFVSESVTHTNHDQNAWWEIDLGSEFDIETITLHPRADCCQSRLTDFRLFISSAPFDSQELDETLLQPGVAEIHATGTLDASTSWSANQLGRYVRVQLSGKNFMSLAEVEIMATTTSMVARAQGLATLEQADALLPDKLALSAVYPNPFRSTVNIQYELPESQHVSLSVYDILGRRVTQLVDEMQSAGAKTLTWEGTDASGAQLAAGLYFVVMDAGTERMHRKVVRLQ